MTVAAVEEYRVPVAQRDAFLAAVRESFGLASGHGAGTSLRSTLVGAELTDVLSAVFTFPDAIARRAYLDVVTDPGTTLDAMDRILFHGNVTRLGRTFLDEIPATNEATEPPLVVSSISFRVSPGREAETDQALLAGVELRRGLGIEAHLYVVQYAGSRTGLRTLAIHGASHEALARDAAAVVANRQRLGGLGPIPLAIAAGAMAMTDNSVSNLVAV